MFIPEYFKSNSPRKRQRAGLFSLVTSHWSLATVLIAFLLSAGCADETINNPIAEKPVEDSKPDEIVSTSTNYFPMTAGSRWVYRSPDGSEWSREVTETEQVGSHLYHFFTYSPLIDVDQLDSSETPMYTPTPYVTTIDRLILRIKLSDINDAVQQTIFESGRVPPIHWAIHLRCRSDRRPRCRMRKLESIVRDGQWRQEINNDALMMLESRDARVVWNSELTVLRIPLVPYRRWKAIDVRVSGSSYQAPFWDWEGVGYTHSFEANITISGIAGQPESVVTPAGAFANCLKIRYEMTRLALETTEFNTGWVVFEQRKLDLFEAELRKELTTLFRDGLPRMQLGAVWLAPDIGPVRIERADGISELISYDVKKGSD